MSIFQRIENIFKAKLSTPKSTNETKSNDLSKEIISKNVAPTVLIPAGEFEMGSDDGDPDEKPVHTVYLDAFYMDVYEVTNAQYEKFMNAKGYKAPKYWNDSNYNAPNNPVVGVSWEDAKDYADWANKRLPTEAEWEKAARGGLVGKKYPQGDDITHLDANYTDKGDSWAYTSPVGTFKPNGYGLYDMAGNVLELCSDLYDSEYYSKSPKSNPTGPSSGYFGCVLRGGPWYLTSDALRVAKRRDGNKYVGFLGTGFRCVRDVPNR